MTDKVRQFPQRANGSAAPNEEPMILFTLGDRRFTVQWISNRGACRAGAELILLQKKRRGTGRARPKR